jgi:hypothetical protein
MVITGRIGSMAAYSLEPAHGFMAVMTSMATSTIAMIRTTDMRDRCRSVERGRSTIFTRTKREMDEAT